MHVYCICEVSGRDPESHYTRERLHRADARFPGLYLLRQFRGVGGTWYWNRHPGARCNVERMQYSFAFDEALPQNIHWPVGGEYGDGISRSTVRSCRMAMASQDSGMPSPNSREVVPPGTLLISWNHIGNGGSALGRSEAIFNAIGSVPGVSFTLASRSVRSGCLGHRFRVPFPDLDIDREAWVLHDTRTAEPGARPAG